GATNRSAFSTYLLRSLVVESAIQRPSGDQAMLPFPITLSLRTGPPASATTPMSARFWSSGLPVGLTTNAIERESGDQRAFQTHCSPEVSRRVFPVATSTTQRCGYWRRSSSTTWSHFFLRQSRTFFGSESERT